MVEGDWPNGHEPLNVFQNMGEIDAMLQEGFVEKVRDIVLRCEEIVKQKKKSLDELNTAAYPEIVQAVSAVRLLHDKSSEIRGLLTNFEALGEKINREIMTSITLDQWRTLTSCDISQNQEVCCFTVAQDRYVKCLSEWLRLSYPCSLSLNLLSPQQITSNAFTRMGQKFQEAALEAFLALPRRVMEFIFINYPLPAVFLLVVVAPYLINILTQCEFSRNTCKTLVHRHIVYCRSLKFLLKTHDIAMQSLTKRFSEISLSFRTADGARIFNLFVSCNCSTCLPMATTLTYPNTAYLLEALVVLFFLSHHSPQSLVETFISSRHDVMNQLLQQLKQPHLSTPMTLPCRFMQSVQSGTLKTDKSDYYLTFFEQRTVTLACRLAAILLAVERSIEVLKIFTCVEPYPFLQNVRDALFTNVATDGDEDLKSDQCSLCTCSLCDINGSRGRFHFWLGVIHFVRMKTHDKETFCQLRFDFLNVWQQKLQNTFDAVISSYTHDEYEAVLNMMCSNQLWNLVSALILDNKIEDFKYFMCHPLFQKKMIMDGLAVTLSNHTPKIFTTFNHNTYFNTQWCHSLEESQALMRGFCDEFLRFWSETSEKYIERLMTSVLQNLMDQASGKAQLDQTSGYQLVVTVERLLDTCFTTIRNSSCELYGSFFCSLGLKISKTQADVVRAMKDRAIVKGFINYLTQQATSCSSKKPIHLKEMESTNLFPLTVAQFHVLLLTFILSDNEILHQAPTLYPGLHRIYQILNDKDAYRDLVHQFGECHKQVLKMCQERLHDYWFTALSFALDVFKVRLSSTLLKHIMDFRDNPIWMENPCENGFDFHMNTLYTGKNGLTQCNPRAKGLHNCDADDSLLSDFTYCKLLEENVYSDKHLNQNNTPHITEGDAQFHEERGKSNVASSELLRAAAMFSVPVKRETPPNEADVDYEPETRRNLEDNSTLTDLKYEVAQNMERASQFKTVSKVSWQDHASDVVGNSHVNGSQKSMLRIEAYRCLEGLTEFEAFIQKEDYDAQNSTHLHEPENKWLPAEPSKELLFLLFKANDQLLCLHNIMSDVLRCSIPSGLSNRVHQLMQKSLLDFLDVFLSECYTINFIEIPLKEQGGTIPLHCISQVLFDLTVTQLLDASHEMEHIKTVFGSIQNTYLKDVIDEILCTKNQINESVEKFIDECRSVFDPLAACPEVEFIDVSGDLSISAKPRSLIWQVNPVADSIPLLPLDDSVTILGGISSETQHSYKHLSQATSLVSQSLNSVQLDSSLERTPYLNVNSLSGFLRGQVVGLSSRVSGVIKQCHESHTEK